MSAGRKAGPPVLALIAIAAVSAAHAVKPSAKPQEVFAPYWTSEPGWETELQLKNNLSSGSLTVTPVLRLASGEEIALEPLTIASNASASVEISQALLQHSPMLVNQPGSYGSVVFRFTSFHPRNLTASAEVSLHGSPIGFHVAAYPALDSEPFPGSALAGSREGIWWQPRVPGSDVLILSNSAQKALPGTLWLSDAAGKRWSKPLPLAAHQTVRLDMRELIASSGLTGQYGGIRFEVPVNAGALGSVHFMYDELAKSSSALEMFTRTTVAAASSAKPWTTRAPMLALRNPDPAVGLPAKTLLQPTILVRNTTARQVAANITLAWRGDSGKGQVKLPPLNMAPFVTQQLQIGAMQKRLGIPDDAHWALVTLTSSTAPNDVIAVVSSYDASGRYNLQTPFSPTVAGHFAGGEWRVNAEHNQIIAVTNSGQKPTNALLTLHYDNGQKSYEVQQAIQPGDQMWVNMASLVRNRVPDRNGNVLPTDATFGTYDLRDLAAGLGSLTPGQLGLDSTFGFSIAPPPYPGCCGTSSPDWGVDDFDLSVDDVSLDPIYATDTCNGDSENISGSFSDWWSGNTSIATVTNKAVTGVSAGTTTANAKGVIFLDGCFEDPVQETAPVVVQGVPSGEITDFESLYQISAAQFLMTLEPSTYSYDNNPVTESSPVIGTNTCWWSGSNMVQFPVVQGSTWVVDQGGDAGHNQYGLDTVGYGSAVVNLIQTQGAEHDVEFPCVVTIHQSMNYSGIDLYVTNLLTQTIGSNTVTVCRAGVCSATIQY